MSTNKPSSLPTDAFEDLLPALVDLVAAIHCEDEPLNVHKQSVAQAVRVYETLSSHGVLSVVFVSQTNVFKQRMAAAKDIVDTLPGGEMSLSDQDEVIAMLKALRDQKRSVHDFPAVYILFH